MTAAVLMARVTSTDAFQALPVRREDHHQLFRQQGGADAGVVRAARARIDQHVAEMLGQGIGEAAEQGRAGVEQLIPAHLRQAFAVALASKRPARIRYSGLPWSTRTTYCCQSMASSTRCASAASSRPASSRSLACPPPRAPAVSRLMRFELLPARLKELKHARPFLVLLEIMVQAWRFHVPVQHQHGHAGVFHARQQDGDVRQAMVRPVPPL